MNLLLKNCMRTFGLFTLSDDPSFCVPSGSMLSMMGCPFVWYAYGEFVLKLNLSSSIFCVRHRSFLTLILNFFEIPITLKEGIRFKNLDYPRPNTP